MLNALPSWIAPSTPNTGHPPAAGNVAHGDEPSARGGFAGVLNQAKAPAAARQGSAPICKPAQPARPSETAATPEPESPRDDPTPSNALPPKPSSRGGAAQGARPRPGTATGKADKPQAAHAADPTEPDAEARKAGKRAALASADQTEPQVIDPMVMQAAARAAAQDQPTPGPAASPASSAGDAAAWRDSTDPATNIASNTAADTAANTAADTGAFAASAPTPAGGHAATTLDVTLAAAGDKATAVVPLAATAPLAAGPTPTLPATGSADGLAAAASVSSPGGLDSRLLGDANAAQAGARAAAATAPTPGAAATAASIGAAGPKDLELSASATTPVQAAEGASANAQPNPAAGLSFATGLADALSPKAGAQATATAEVRVPAAVNSPEFAPALGLTLSTLAANGVQEARLQLHPAELGPISVQIAVDGTGARIDFQADVAQTRQAIEDSLPSLAGALRDAGLTLTGGGVSQHARQPGQPGAHGAVRGPTGAANEDLAAIDNTLGRTVQRRGLVDLLA